MRKYHEIKSDFDSKQLVKDLDAMSIGCFIIVYEDPDGFVEPIVMHRFM